MIKISHTKLEQLRNDPRSYQGLSTQQFYGPSVFRFWQYAIRHYHQSSGNRINAVTYFEDKFRNNFKTESLLDTFNEYLFQYFDSFEALDCHTFEIGKKIQFPIGSDVMLTGEIPRIDLVVSGGYSVYFFSKEITTWQSQLRLPLIQRIIASELDCDESNVSVGVYTLPLAEHESKVYSKSDIESALVETSKLAQQISAF